MSWTENTLSRCNNESCALPIYWNSLILHPVTKRPRPLDEPYYPDTAKAAVLHLCMKDKPPKQFINKYVKYYTSPGYTPEQVEAMKDPAIKAEWERGVQEWLWKWEQK